MPWPILYEVNTRCWLRELSDQAGVPLTLGEVPDSELERWRSLGFTHIWFMGVWQVGENARQLALENWRQHWREQIPSEVSDVHGSPFAIREYALDSRLGQPIDLLLLRERLGRLGLRLILDFVPNHLGIDSPEPNRYPARFVQMPANSEGSFACETRLGIRHFAHGRDPYFQPWSDTVQIDYRVAETHAAVSAIAQTASMYAHGLRCDMSMLILPPIFERTWAQYPPQGNHLTRENFWRRTIPAIRQLQPEVDLIAEVYWDHEEELQASGFDFTYNKRVYDYLVRAQFRELKLFLTQCSARYLAHSLHFLENHDEARAAATLPFELHKAAALLILALPGMVLFHEGQLEGRKTFAHIQMNKRARETVDLEVARFYRDLLHLLGEVSLRSGKPEIIDSADRIITIAWVFSPERVILVFVNLEPDVQMGAATVRPQFNDHKVIYQTKVGLDLWIEMKAGQVQVQLPPQSGIMVEINAPA